MSDLNVVVAEGHLVRTASLSYWPDGTPYCDFAIANNEPFKKSQDEWDSIPSFFECNIKGKYAEAMAKHLVKGRGIRVIGRLKQQRWEKDGIKYSRVVIKVSELKLSPLANNNAGAVYPPPPQQRQPMTDDDLDYVPFEELGEDIPF